MSNNFPPHNNLTDRHKDVLKCLAQGMRNKEIAEKLNLAISTVQTYNTEIYSILQVGGRREAAQYARKHGLFSFHVIKNEQTKHNLPPDKIAFVGRVEEIARLRALIDNDDTRLITILAPGGMGKTHLAIKVASTYMDTFRDGVFFVPLQPVANPTQIMTTVAKHLNLVLVSDHLSPEEQVLDILKQKQLLLIMDNYEHLLDGAHWVKAILEQAHDIKIIVTSRERLHFMSEYVMQLKGLDHKITENMSDAAKLFLDSVRRLNTNFVMKNSYRADIDRICDLTNGMPLALLLASAWSNTLTIPQIADELASGLNLLRSQSRDLPERHQKIRSVFEPTWQKLTHHERLTFAKMSIFAGGCTYEAADYVAGADPQILNSLANKALVTLTTAGRYEIHELLRQFAEEKLHEFGKYESTRQAHAEFYANQMHWYGNEFFKVGSRDKLAPELDNIRLMWWYLIEFECWELMETTMIGYRRFLNFFSIFYEASNWFKSAIHKLEQSTNFTFQQSLYGCLCGCLHCCYIHTGHGNTSILARQILEILADCKLTVYSAYILINTQIEYIELSGDSSNTHAIFQRVAPIFEASNLQNGYSNALLMQYTHHLHAEPEIALEYGMKAIQVSEQIGDLAHRSWASKLVGDIKITLFQYEEALDFLFQSYTDFNRLHHQSYISHILNAISLAYYLTGQYKLAIEALETAIKHCQTYEIIFQQVINLFMLCEIYLELQDTEQAENYLQLAKSRASSFTVAQVMNKPKALSKELYCASWLELQRGNYHVTEQICKKALHLLSKPDFSWSIEYHALQQHIYAKALIAQHQHEEAIEILKSALKSATSIHAYQQLQIIMTYAQLSGKFRQIQLLSFVAEHPGTAPLNRKDAQKRLDNLSTRADPHTFNQAIEQSQHDTLDTLIAELTA